MVGAPLVGGLALRHLQRGRERETEKKPGEHVTQQRQRQQRQKDGEEMNKTRKRRREQKAASASREGENEGTRRRRRGSRPVSEVQVSALSSRRQAPLSVLLQALNSSDEADGRFTQSRECISRIHLEFK